MDIHALASHASQLHESVQAGTRLAALGSVCCCTEDVHAQLTVTWPTYLLPWLVWVQGGAQEAVGKALQGRNSGSQASFLLPQGEREVAFRVRVKVFSWLDRG